MATEIQKDEWCIPGNLGIMRVGENVRVINHLINHNDGYVTLTVCMCQYPKPPQHTADAEFQIIQPNQISNETTNGA